MADFLDEKTAEIKARIKELKPLVDEYQRLEAAQEALGGPVDAMANKHASRKQGSSSTRSTRSASRSSRGAGKLGRPKGSGHRGQQALELVKAQPGITIPEIAQKMGIKQNYLYRVLPALAEEGLVEKKDRSWHPK